MMMGIVVLAVVALPACMSCFYLAVMTLLSWKEQTPKESARQLRFNVIVPAHNEVAVIERIVGSLKNIDWPEDRFRVTVVADNCTDATALLASAAGARVIERFDTTKRGKGHALSAAFAASQAEGWADALVIVDADSEVTPNLLEAFASRIEYGALALQACYGVLNPDLSWRTRLLAIAHAAFHDVRSRARERLGLSSGLRGNGWCVTTKLLERVPYAAFSLTEDLEFGISLGLAGVRVHYADEARVCADMVAGEQVAAQQRKRWEAGRFAMIRSQTMPLLSAAVGRPSAVCFDLALDLLVLPLSYVAINVIVLIVLTAVIQPQGSFWYWLEGLCFASLLCYVLRGWQISKQGARGLFDLARAPFFIVWKMMLILRRGSAGWVSTKREDR